MSDNLFFRIHNINDKKYFKRYKIIPVYIYENIENFYWIKIKFIALYEKISVGKFKISKLKEAIIFHY